SLFTKLAPKPMIPSPTEPVQPLEGCAGMPTNQRIPLEDELTGDGDDVESSWRHYLDLATQAAQEADMLGEEVIARGLEIDVAGEKAAEDLERICGASV